MRIDPKLTVAEIARRYPEALKVFASRRIDLCCGGGHSLEVVAEKHGVDLAKLLKELEEAIAVAS